LLNIAKAAKDFTANHNRKKNKGYLGSNVDDYNLSTSFPGCEEVLDKYIRICISLRQPSNFSCF